MDYLPFADVEREKWAHEAWAPVKKNANNQLVVYFGYLVLFTVNGNHVVVWNTAIKYNPDNTLNNTPLRFGLLGASKNLRAPFSF